jgi:hypothetical protein
MKTHRRVAEMDEGIEDIYTLLNSKIQTPMNSFPTPPATAPSLPDIPEILLDFTDLYFDDQHGQPP